MGQTKSKWSAENPSPAAILMERLGAPTSYSGQYGGISRIRSATAPKFSRTKARMAAKRARIARRITARYGR